MESQERFPIIKKAISTSLEKNLANCTKNQLISISENLNLSIKKSWKKEQLVQKLYENIYEQFHQFYQPVITDLLDKFGDQIEQAIAFENLKQLEVIAPLIKKGFFYVYLQKDLYILVIPDEIWQGREESDLEMQEVTIDLNSNMDNNQLLSAQKEDSLSTKYDSLKQWKETVVKIYGKVYAEHLAEIWNRYNVNKLTPTEIDQILNS
ncbi:hypothetical protein [Marinilactibacillus psychrotolerans]|uniref:Uncharacterized protein n=1 Tax=Marinilactibacillus psychrotolerans TaxID=191770 RepID=A0AAV3WA74_9LACT|nr:hypothetical protein [Marinilactibacillus psychrotolerans]GEL67875.1 hypothetical protein MPS01_20300 [Marinilactibacillus psychrotolerans]GEQ36611.1 hypothetical protein M132T_21190 [Marinilactibacillus psychrotolerans]SDD10475.1 hypothetical protein SAMN04488013_11711 [Marinilactibacillus psychrotolerans]